MPFLFIIIIIFILSGLLSFAYIFYAQKNNFLDIPNHRSSHTRITPRGGGSVFISLWVLFFFIAAIFKLCSWNDVLIFIPGTLVVAVTGYLDDRLHLSAKYRALFYFIAAILTLIVMGGFQQLILTANGYLPLPWIGSILAAFILVWSINLFNFMDGIDGIAAIESLFVLGVGGFFFWASHGEDLALLAWWLAASVAGFLLWNKPPAKLFMGDVGSASLGFIIMVFALVGERKYHIPLLLWVIVYGVFIFDATITLLRRILAKEKWYEAHRSHAYQRLHQFGFSHGKVDKWVILTNILLSCLAIIGFYHHSLILWLLLSAVVLLGGLYLKIEKLKPMYTAG